MTTVAEHLVGRAAELDALDAVAARVEEGEPAAVLVTGEPGIGKSRLLDELAARIAASGWTVLRGSASELEVDLPFWIFVDALEAHVAALEPRRLATLDADVRRELAQLLPALADGGGPAGPPALDERYRVHRAVRELLERLAPARPLALLLDDAHWADPASIELIAALLRTPPAAPVMLVLAARGGQIPGRLAAALERGRRGGALTGVELAALGREEAGELLQRVVDAALADELYRESGGNPFYLEQLARALHRPGAVAPGSDGAPLGGVGVPAAVAASVGAELALLAPPARRILEGAAVAGDPFEPELAAAAADADERAAAAAIDELLALGLLRPADGPRRFGFRHPLIRRAVYDAAPGGWRLGAHERCAAALAERGASVTARAHHVEQAGRQGDPAALAVLQEAAATAAARAPASAARWLGAALRLLPETAPVEQRLGLLTARAGALAATGELVRARADLLEAIDLLPAEATGPRTQLVAGCAGIEHLLGEHATARDRLLDALERLSGDATAEAVDLTSELAVSSLFDAEYAAMSHWAERAMDAARPLDDPALLASAAALRAIAEASAGNVREAQAHRAEARALVDALPDDALARRLAAAGSLAQSELYLDRYREAAMHAARGLEVAVATGQMSPTLVPALVTARFMLGELAEAAALVEGALEAAYASGIPQALAWTLVNRSGVLLIAGDLDGALAAAEESYALATRLDERFMTAWAAYSLAMALVEAGQHERAVSVLPPHAGGEKLTAVPAAWRVFGFEVLVRSRLALGDGAGARRSLALAELTASALGLPMSEALAGRCAALVALDGGRPAAAAERALASAAAAERTGAVVEAARSRTLAGEALARAGDTARGVAELEAAAAVLEATGARRHRDAAERELRRLGRAVHRRSRPGLPGVAGFQSLTERELQVARLVVDRKTNPQIAAELFLSRKTIETHLRNIFHKLDVSSRVEVARVVERVEAARRV